MAAERMTERLVTLVKPSELAEIKSRAKAANLNTSDYVRRSVLGEPPPTFDALAEELIASASRADAAMDKALKAVADSEARLAAHEVQKEGAL